MFPQSRPHVSIAKFSNIRMGWEDMKAKGFTAKSDTWKWTDAQLSTLRKAAKEISQNPGQVHVQRQNIYYYISVTRFGGLIPKAAIKTKINQQTSAKRSRRKQATKARQMETAQQNNATRSV